MLCSKCQIYGEDFVNFSDLLGKYELYCIRDFSCAIGLGAKFEIETIFDVSLIYHPVLQLTQQLVFSHFVDISGVMHCLFTTSLLLKRRKKAINFVVYPQTY